MRQFIKSKKGSATLATLVVVGASALGAYAFFTSSGSGSGSAAASSAASSVNITLGVALTPGIAPGGSEPVSFSGTNAGVTGGDIQHITFDSVGVVGDSSSGLLCTTYLANHQADFSMATVTEPGSGIVVPGSTPATPTALGNSSLVWANNNLVDQTPCAGQNLQLNVNWN